MQRFTITHNAIDHGRWLCWPLLLTALHLVVASHDETNSIMVSTCVAVVAAVLSSFSAIAVPALSSEACTPAAATAGLSDSWDR